MSHFDGFFPPGVTAARLESVLPDRDPRSIALDRLRDYLALIVFSRTMGAHRPAQSFRIPRVSIQPERPDNVVELNLPAIAFIPGVQTLDSAGLGPPAICEGTADLHAPGTAVASFGERLETIVIEVVAAKRASRRAVVAGLEVALRPFLEVRSLRLTLPLLYGAVASFELASTQYIDDERNALNRRVAHLSVNMRVPDLYLVKVVPFAPSVLVEEVSVEVEVVPSVVVEVA